MVFFKIKFYHEIGRESFEIAANRLFEFPRFNSIQPCQIRIQHHLLPTDLINQILDDHQIFAHIARTI